MGRHRKQTIDGSVHLMDPTTRVLIAGIGNIFLGDDAFGSEVARRLQAQPWPAGVRVVDFGIRGFDLAYALCDGNDLTVLIDATPRGGSPGTVYVIEPDLTELADNSRSAALVDAHSLDPLQVLRMAHAQGVGFVRRTERRVLNAEYVKTSGVWAIAKVEFANEQPESEIS